MSPPGLPTEQRCDLCEDGSRVEEVHRAANVYAAAPVGDHVGLQREILAHGPVQVGFYVYADFMAYHSGVYRRSSSATRPVGGHAVRIIGWGEAVDPKANATAKYWLCANSWSAAWGEGGFFRIRRGTNEAGIESTPAAGIPAL